MFKSSHARYANKKNRSKGLFSFGIPEMIYAYAPAGKSSADLPPAASAVLRLLMQQA